MRHTLTRAAGVSLLVAGLITPIIALASAPAAATGTCRTSTVDQASAFTTSGGGTAQLVDGGVIMSTPEQPSKVSYRHELSAPVPLTKVAELSYITDRQAGATGHDQTVAAYKLAVDIQGDGTVDGSLVYEPYYNRTVTAGEQSQDALAGGAGKWWYTAEPGNKQTLATFDQWTAGTGPVAFTSPVARAFAVEQGTYNTGAITLVTRVKFKADSMCKIIRFDCPPPVTTPTTTKPTVTPTTTRPTTPPTTRPTPTTMAPTTTTPPPVTGGEGGGGDDAGDSLPVTGPTIGIAAGIAALLLAGGAALLYTGRRRRTRYVA
jgi:LPXTG-motif cell wall-anchored protein